MIQWFRRLLIRIGKILPFVLAFILFVNYVEILYAVASGQMYEDIDGCYVYATPISSFIGDIVYIDYLDVLLMYIMSVALELCWRNRMAIHYITLSLALRFALETTSMSEWAVIPLCALMALLGLICVCLGIRIIAIKK